MLSKKTLILGIFAVFMAISPLIAMEENNDRGLKRTYDLMNSNEKSEQKDELATTSKKAKSEVNAEWVLFELADGKEFTMSRELASLSSTLAEAISLGSSNNDSNTVIRVRMTYYELLTQERFQHIAELLQYILHLDQGKDIDLSYHNNLVEQFTGDSEEAHILNGIVSFFDLDKQLKDIVEEKDINFFSLIAEDGQEVLIRSWTLLKSEYFKVMLSSNLLESQTLTMQTYLSFDDLSFIVTLLNESMLYRDGLESNFIQYLEGKISNVFIDEKHSINALIQQSHQWELVGIRKALIKYVVDYASQETIEELLHVLPVMFDKEVFSTEVIDLANVGKLFTIFLKRLLSGVALVEVPSLDEKEKEKEKEKEDEAVELNVSLENISVESLYAFKSFIESNSRYVVSIISNTTDLPKILNEILTHYELIVTKLEQSNSLLVGHFEELFKSVLIYYVPVNNCQTFEMKKAQSMAMPQFRGIVSNNRYIETFYAESEKNHVLAIKNYFNDEPVKAFPLLKYNVISPIFTLDNYCFVKIDTQFVRFNVDVYPIKLEKIDIRGFTPIVLNKDLFCVLSPHESEAIIIDFATKSKIKKFDFRSQITKAFMFDDAKTIIFILENNQVICFNMETNETKVFVATKGTENISSGVILNTNKFILGYSTGRLCLFDRETGFEKELRAEDKFPGISDLDFSTVAALHSCHDGIHFIAVCSKKTMPRDKYEIWNYATGKREFESEYDYASLFVGVQDGYLIIKNLHTLKLYFMPILVPCKDIVKHMKKFNKHF